jgi:hypothetical protein
MGCRVRYLLAAVRIRELSVAATISYGLEGDAALACLQKREAVAAPVVARNCRLVVMIVNCCRLSKTDRARRLARDWFYQNHT